MENAITDAVEQAYEQDVRKIAMVIAVRQALDNQSTLLAAGVCIIGWAIQAIILMILFAALGGGRLEPNF